MTALHQFGAEMLKLSRGLQSFTPFIETCDYKDGKSEDNPSNSNLGSSTKHTAKIEWYGKQIYELV
jgi:hypothetical protein